VDGVMATQRLLKQYPEARVIALSMYEHGRAISRMIDAGAQGFISKSGVFDELINAIETVMGGEAYIGARLAGVVLKHARATSNPKGAGLTPRESEVLKLIAEGHSTKEAATILGVSAKTIEVHRKNVIDKTGAKTVAKLTHLAIREGIVELAQ
jgi:DNA-binding NarL/FixJ family response regulator